MSKKTILLLHSSQILMDYTKRILERAGYRVRCAACPAGAREALLDYPFDGILLESDFSGGRGIEYCRTLTSVVDAPVMVLSGSRGDELPALQAGAFDVLKKPYDFEVMKARLHVMLGEQAWAPLRMR